MMADSVSSYISEEQKKWFGDRMDETASGRVTVPPYLYTKFRKITNNEFISNADIKEWLITECY